MFLQSFDKSFVLPILAMFIYVKVYEEILCELLESDFYRQNRGGSKLTRGSSQVNLTLRETETRVQAYFATPFLNFKIFLKVHIKFLHKP
jgi:hypothetical protein